MELKIEVDPDQRSPLQIITDIQDQLDALIKRKSIISYTISILSPRTEFVEQEAAILHTQGYDEKETD